MRKQFNKKPIFLAAAALALTATLSVGSAMAYFTTYTTASGSVPLDLGYAEIIPHDEVDAAGKHVAIENTGEFDCYVRVKLFSVIDLKKISGEGWSEGGDGYWYYNSILAAGATTPELLAEFEYPAGDDKAEEFNIIVVSECAPVVYDSNNNPTADWDHKIITDGTE